MKRVLDTNIVLYLLGGRLAQPLDPDEYHLLRREHRLKLPDAIIAATAVVLDAELLTNDQHFLHVPGLRSSSVSLA